MTDKSTAGMKSLINFGDMWPIALASWHTLHFLGFGFLLAETMSLCGLQVFRIKHSTSITDILLELARY